MAFFDCMVKALKEGRVTEKMYQGMEDHLKANGIDLQKSDFHTPEERKILEDAIRNVDEQMALKKKQLVLATEARERNEKMLRTGVNKPTIIENPVMSTLIDSLQKIDNRSSVIKQQWGAQIDKFFQKYAKGNFLGNFLRNETDRDKFGREMMVEGSSKSGEHGGLAKDVQKVMDESVRRRSDAGEDIKRLSHYGLPTNHDGIAMGKSGFAAWSKSAMENFATIGGKPLKAIKDLPKVLKQMFDDIRSQHAGLSPSDSLEQHRVIGFGNDYDKWKAYNKDFGMSAGDPVNAIQSHLSAAANKISMMEEFGPKPVAMIKHLRDFAFKTASETSNDVSQIARDLKKFDGIYRSMTDTDSPLSKAGAFYQGFRSAIYMRIAEVAYLSQATVDLFSRVPTLKMINNLPASSITHMFGNYLKTLGSDDARQLALRAGVAGDNFFSELHKGNDAIIRDHPIMGRVMSVNDPMARAFFVHAHMESLPRIMALDFLSNFARWKDMEFKDLPIRDSMERNGISESDWNAFRQTEVAEHNGVKMLQPVDMLKRTDMNSKTLRDIATRIGMYINGESRETVPAPNLRNRYALIGNPDPNSVSGMIARDMTIALQFTMSTMMMLQRGFMLKQGLASKIGFAGAAGMALLTANAMRMQAKAVVSGRDFYTMNPTTPQGREFWKTNLMSSGFAGPSLDLLNPQHSGSVTSTIGKVAEAGIKGAEYEGGLTNKNPHAAGKIFNEARHFVPGADGWWSQLLMQHGALDAAQREIDPNAQNEWNHTNQYYQHTYGQHFFWPHGQSMPNRAPQ
jgi:hypothetical protein